MKQGSLNFSIFSQDSQVVACNIYIFINIIKIIN